MKVPKEILKIWKKQLEHGDPAAIAREYGVDARSVASAKAKGTCHSRIFEAINSYLTQKKIRNENFIKIQKNDE